MVFIGAMLVDIVPFPLPPAFTVMILLQIKYDLPIWPVVAIGVTGSVVGRFILTLYIPKVSSKVFNRTKKEDVEFLGSKLKQKPVRSNLFVLAYSLMPLPTTPLFLAAGMARLTPLYIIPAFLVGKSISNAIAVTAGNYAANNASDLLHGATSWKSILILILGLLMIFALLFLDWRLLLREKKLRLKFDIWKKKK